MAEQPAVPPAIRHVLRLHRSDRLVVGIAVFSGLLLLAVSWIRLSDWGRKPIEAGRVSARRYDARIDINGAAWIDWVHMDGIGEVLADRILEDRAANGPFTSIDDLQRVRGIGPKTVEKLRPWLKVDPVNRPKP